MKDGVPVHIAASLLAGTAATTACAPADVLKSRMQSSNGKSQVCSLDLLVRTICRVLMLVKGLVKILKEGMRSEGPAFLMKGWTPAWLRLG